MKITLSSEDLKGIIGYLVAGELPDDLDIAARKRFIARAKRFAFEDGKLYGLENGIKLLAIAEDDPVALVNALNNLHMPNHTGMKAMYEASKVRYVGFRRDQINVFVRNCLVCQRNAALKHGVPIQPIVASRRWERIIIDFIDMRKFSATNNGFGWILNCVDSYSKFIYAERTKSKSAGEVARFLSKLINTEGAPEILHTDNGKEFCNAKITDICVAYSIRHVKGRPRHPQSQGQVERANQTLVRHLTKNLDSDTPTRWVDFFEETVARYNLTWHRAINMTPMVMFRGRPGFNTQMVFLQDGEEDNSGHSATLSNVDDDAISFDDTDLVISSSSTELGALPSTVSPCYDELRREDEILQEYRPKYIASMQNYADVHYKKLKFKRGDEVLIKKDFDNNTNSRREKLQDFYEEGIWTVVCRKPGDTILVEQGDSKRHVSKGCLKLYKRKSHDILQ